MVTTTMPVKQPIPTIRVVATIAVSNPPMTALV
jgi:hypothetical protein